jgi:hypothetical protein
MGKASGDFYDVPESNVMAESEQRNKIENQIF